MLSSGRVTRVKELTVIQPDLQAKAPLFEEALRGSERKRFQSGGANPAVCKNHT